MDCGRAVGAGCTTTRCDWLAGRATASDQIGQGTLQPIENPWEKADVHDWSKETFGGDVCTKPARGVIGLHSTLSDGKASPEALIAQARQSGLQWVAFTEKLESLAADPWKPGPSSMPA